MKVGDVIFSIKHRPYEKATIIKHKLIKKEDGSIRSNYIARYSDGKCWTFYPPSINHTVFKDENKDQITLFDYFGGDI